MASSPSLLPRLVATLITALVHLVYMPVGATPVGRCHYAGRSKQGTMVRARCCFLSLKKCTIGTSPRHHSPSTPCFFSSLLPFVPPRHHVHQPTPPHLVCFFSFTLFGHCSLHLCPLPIHIFWSDISSEEDTTTIVCIMSARMLPELSVANPFKTKLYAGPS